METEDQAVDVQQTAEGETASTSSSTEQTPVENSADESNVQEEKYVPYDRFKEVNDTLKTYKEELDALKTQIAPKAPEEPTQVDPRTEAVKEQLKALGFITREEQIAEVKRREEDSRVEAELSQLENKYAGSDGLPKFDRSKVINFALDRQIGDLETAYEKLHQKEIIDWHIQQAVAKSRGVKSEASDGSGSSQSGTTNDDLKEAIKNGDRSALFTYIKRQTRQE